MARDIVANNFFGLTFYKAKNDPTVKLENFLFENFEFRKDIISGRVEFRNIYKSDDYTQMDESNWKKFRDTIILDPNFKYCRLSIIKNKLEYDDRVKKYNPILEKYLMLYNTYREQIKKDKLDLLSEWFDCIEVKNKDFDYKYFLTKYFRRYIHSIVKLATREPYHNNFMPVFIGSQGSYKTSLIKSFYPPFIIDNYFQALKLKEIQAMNDLRRISMLGSSMLVWQVDEVNFYNSNESEFYKNLISLDNVRHEVKYKMEMQKFIRFTNYIGTTNEKDYLIDKENRRFGSIEIVKINKIKADKINKNILHAQLYADYLEEFRKNNMKSIHFSKQEISEIEKNNKNYKKQYETSRDKNSFYKDLIQKHFQPIEPEKFNVKNSNHKLMSATDVLLFLSEKYPTLRLDPNLATPIGKILSDLEFKQNSGHSNGRNYILNLIGH